MSVFFHLRAGYHYERHLSKDCQMAFGCVHPLYGREQQPAQERLDLKCKFSVLFYSRPLPN